MIVKIPFLTWTNKAALDVEIPDDTEEGLRLKAALRVAISTGADLRGSDFCGSDLRGADMYGAHMYGSDLRRTDMRGADMRRTDLRLADMRGADLRGAHMYGAHMYGADMRDANMRGAVLEDSITLVGDRPVLVLGPLGSRNDELTAFNTSAGIKVSTGCFYDTLDQFERAIAREHGSNEHGMAYMAAVALIKTLWPPGSVVAPQGAIGKEAT